MSHEYDTGPEYDEGADAAEASFRADCDLVTALLDLCMSARAFAALPLPARVAVVDYELAALEMSVEALRRMARGAGRP